MNSTAYKTPYAQVYTLPDRKAGNPKPKKRSFPVFHLFVIGCILAAALQTVQLRALLHETERIEASLSDLAETQQRLHKEAREWIASPPPVRNAGEEKAATASHTRDGTRLSFAVPAGCGEWSL